MSKPKRPRTETPSVLTGEQRINKLLAAAGLGSRRQVDELITDGRVEIDGKTITQVGVKVDADTAKISVDGEPLKRHRPLYFAVHKPAGVLCTNSDPEGRPRVIDLVPGQNRLFPVGRLDSSSTGLILLTNDGELAQRLAHPRNRFPRATTLLSPVKSRWTPCVVCNAESIWPKDSQEWTVPRSVAFEKVVPKSKSR